VIPVRISSTTASVTQSRLQRARRFAVADRGFSMIEVMVSALIVILLAGAAAKALIATTHASGSQRVHNQADGLATQDQERLRGMSDEQLNQLSGPGQTRAQVFNGQTFSVKSTATAEDATGSSSCTSSAAAYYKISSTVSWADAYDSQTPSATEDSILARPVSGDLLADVKDQTGSWLSGVGVTAASTAQPNQLGSTDVNGCVVFAGLAPAAWTVTLSKSGYVDPTGAATPGGSATVSTTGMASIPSLPIYLGPAGSIQATFTTATGAAAESDGLSSLGSGSSGPSMSSPAIAPKTDTNSPTTSQLSDPLFPFAYMNSGTASYTNNYAEWGGRCPEQEPPAGTSPVTTPTQVSVNPGVTGVGATIYEPLLNLSTVTYTNSLGSTSNQKPNDVEMKYSTPVGATVQCSDTWWASLVGTGGTTAPTGGWLARPGQAYAPASTLKICADYTPDGGSHYYYGVSSTTQNTNFGAAATVSGIAIIRSNAGKCSL
jgi:Tfp pilus assembly protein PilV